jgi:hypothetical protein
VLSWVGAEVGLGVATVGEDVGLDVFVVHSFCFLFHAHVFLFLRHLDLWKSSHVLGVVGAGVEVLSTHLYLFQKPFFFQVQCSSLKHFPLRLIVSHSVSFTPNNLPLDFGKGV